MTLVVFGVGLFAISSVLLFWGEENRVKSDATANEVKFAQDVGCDPRHWTDGRLVFAACLVQTPDIQKLLPSVLEPLVPPFHGLNLSWDVRILQWEETWHRRVNEECDYDKEACSPYYTYYTYSTVWSRYPISSSSFNDTSYHNVGNLPLNLGSGSALAEENSVTMGAFVLDKALTDSFPDVSVPVQALNGTSRFWRGSGNLRPNMLHNCGSGILCTFQASPSIGDLTISLTGHSLTSATVCAKQVPLSFDKYTFVPYPRQPFDSFGRHTYELRRLVPRIETKQEFEQKWHHETLIGAWVVRVVCLVCLVGAFAFCVEDVEGRLRRGGFGCCGLGELVDDTCQLEGYPLAGACGTFWFVLFMALAWLTIHPIWSLGIVLLIVGGYAVTHYGTLYKKLGRQWQTRIGDKIKVLSLDSDHQGATSSNTQTHEAPSSRNVPLLNSSASQGATPSQTQSNDAPSDLKVPLLDSGSQGLKVNNPRANEAPSNIEEGRTPDSRLVDLQFSRAYRMLFIGLGLGFSAAVFGIVLLTCLSAYY